MHYLLTNEHGLMDVNIRDIWQSTPLHVAVREGLKESTLFLLEEGADVEARDHVNDITLETSP